MKKTITALSCLLAAGLALSSCPVSAAESLQERIQAMTLEEKIGQMFMPAFRTWKDNPEDPDAPAVPVLTLNEEIASCVARSHFGGVILFADNSQDAVQTLSLASAFQEANAAESSIPLFLAIDQEGGTIARLAVGTRGIGNMALSATGSGEAVRESAKTIGEELSLLHLNTDFAPVVDINNNPANPIIGVRSFGDDPELVAKNAALFLEGLHESDIISTIKHFPGHGDTATDSHTGFPLVDKSYGELKSLELIPFASAVDAGVDMVMTAHIQYPQIETQTYTSITTGEEVFLPATLSKTILTDILRGDLGFEGVIVSDALEMAAIHDNFAMEDVLRLAVDAGVNLFLIPVTVSDAGSMQELENMISFLVSQVQEGNIAEETIDNAVEHILKVKEAHGLLDPVSPVTEEDKAAALAEVGSGARHEMEWAMAQRAITLVKGEDVLPLAPAAGESVVFFSSSKSRLLTAEFARNRLVEEGLLSPEVAINALCYSASPEEQEAVLADCQAALAEADYSILLSTMWGLSDLNPTIPEGVDSDTADKLIASAHEQGKKVVLISANLPYDIARYQEADAILLTYGSYPMNALPEGGAAYMANLPAAICGIFGEYPFTGSLPISIPALNEDYQFSGEILYERQIQ